MGQLRSQNGLASMEKLHPDILDATILTMRYQRRSYQSQSSTFGSRRYIPGLRKIGETVTSNDIPQNGYTTGLRNCIWIFAGIDDNLRPGQTGEYRLDEVLGCGLYDYLVLIFPIAEITGNRADLKKSVTFEIGFWRKITSLCIIKTCDFSLCTSKVGLSKLSEF